MKNFLFLFSAIIAVCLFSSCEDIHFQQPQPQGKKEIYKIPKRYQGNFSMLDTTYNSKSMELGKLVSLEKGYPNLEVYKILNIYSTMVINGYKGKLEFTSNQAIKLKEIGWTIDSIANAFSVKVENLKELNENGLLVFDYYNSDTLINISGGDVVKKFKGKLYLNTKDDDKWVVHQLQKSGCKKIILRAVNKDDKEILKTMRPDDNSVFNPTLDEFKVFLKKGGFQEVEIYNKE